MSKLTIKKAVHELALALSETERNGRVRVSDSFLRAIEFQTRQAVVARVRHHDNKTGRRKTLV